MTPHLSYCLKCSPFCLLSSAEIFPVTVIMYIQADTTLRVLVKILTFSTPLAGYNLPTSRCRKTLNLTRFKCPCIRRTWTFIIRLWKKLRARLSGC